MDLFKGICASHFSKLDRQVKTIAIAVMWRGRIKDYILQLMGDLVMQGAQSWCFKYFEANDRVVIPTIVVDALHVDAEWPHSFAEGFEPFLQHIHILKCKGLFQADMCRQQ